jgi:hypothetical protein
MSRGEYLGVALIESRLMGLALELEGRSKAVGPLYIPNRLWFLSVNPFHSGPTGNYAMQKAQCRDSSIGNHPTATTRRSRVPAMNKRIATAFLVQAGKAVGSEVLNDAWSIYEDFDQSEH